MPATPSGSIARWRSRVGRMAQPRGPEMRWGVLTSLRCDRRTAAGTFGISEGSKGNIVLVTDDPVLLAGTPGRTP